MFPSTLRNPSDDKPTRRTVYHRSDGSQITQFYKVTTTTVPNLFEGNMTSVGGNCVSTTVVTTPFPFITPRRPSFPEWSDGESRYNKDNRGIVRISDRLLKGGGE